ncbi:hypothetical protein BDK51DRAFT_12779, partial [Blyttiomyces helicus]
LPFQTSFKYLGLPFKTFGIDHHPLCLDSLVKKGYAADAPLNAIGFNGHGFLLPTSVKLHTAFIRPAMEYSLGL